MRTRWKTASELCQLYASVRALDDSRSANPETNTYDFSEPLSCGFYTTANHSLVVIAPLGIWELIQQAGWLIGRCENLLRTLVEWEGRQLSDGMSHSILTIRMFCFILT